MARTREYAAAVAEAVCNAFAAGDRGRIEFNRIPFELTDVARCSEFVRECTEAAWGTGQHFLPYFAGNARHTEHLLQVAGLQVGSQRRGDIVCFNNGDAGKWGHIGILLGNWRFAENTSSVKRGGPGFLISDIDAMQGRVSGYYSLLPSVADTIPPHDPPLLVGLRGEVVTSGRMIQDELWVPARRTVETLGFALMWHEDQGKAYVFERDDGNTRSANCGDTAGS